MESVPRFLTAPADHFFLLGPRGTGKGHQSSEEFIEVIVGTDPKPGHGLAVALGEGAERVVDAHGPDGGVSGEFFEAERRVGRVFPEEPVGTASRLLDLRIERLVGSPEAGPGERDHRRRRSSCSEVSAADSRRNVSRRGRGLGSSSRLSHRASFWRASRKRAKSATSSRLL